MPANGRWDLIRRLKDIVPSCTNHVHKISINITIGQFGPFGYSLVIKFHISTFSTPFSQPIMAKIMCRKPKNFIRIFWHEVKFTSKR